LGGRSSSCAQTLRKASTVYYPHLHLELGRFIELARNVGYNLPPTTLRHLEAGSSSATPAAKPSMHKRSATDGSPRLPELKFA
jgi:hypothetical protein